MAYELSEADAQAVLAALDAANKELGAAREMIDRLHAERVSLTGALAWYAQPAHWVQGVGNTAVEVDGGDRARRALAAWRAQ